MTIPKFRVYDKVECMMITTSDYEDLSDLFCFLKADADTGVFYSQGSFCVDILNGGTPLHGFSSKQLEVIGNIYENPELLEKH